MGTKVIRKGGAFFLEDVPAVEVFTPEDLSEEHEMIASTTQRFVKNEVRPNAQRLEHKDWALNRQLLLKAGELGLLGAEIEEKYGGSEMGIISSMVIVENCAPAGSFGLTLNDHTGIGSTPLILFGNTAQKKKYLPAMARGEKIGAYALTEPGAGTDAMSLKTTAKLTKDGKYYLLNGTKQFITNGAFCDIIFTYAKTEGDKVTAFILERGYEGVSTGPEEKKMGLRGSSTCSIFLDNAKVPVENVLFELGKGHVVAFNILNLGRFKLGAGSVGASKLAIESSVGYAKERIQFNKPICQFGMIKHKIAEMATRTYVAESAVYRICGLIDTILETVDRSADDAGQQMAKSIGEYAIECSIAKVYGTEMLAYVADEAIQIYGGYGYIEEYPVEEIYRDNRVFRIFEGTNEINRVIIMGFLLRKGLKNELPLFSEGEKVKEELKTMKHLTPDASDGPLGYQKRLVNRAKRVFLFLCNEAAQKYGMGIEEEQEILALLSDIAQEVYVMESGLLRAQKSIQSVGENKSKLKIDMVQLYANEAMFKITGYAKQAIAAMQTGEAVEKQLTALEKALRFTPVNAVGLRRAIANEVTDAGKYTC
jgi:alkylation response protein AidB-like acyl-CoA dehydrogenase